MIDQRVLDNLNNNKFEHSMLYAEADDGLNILLSMKMKILSI